MTSILKKIQRGYIITNNDENLQLNMEEKTIKFFRWPPKKHKRDNIIAYMKLKN